MSVPTPEPTPTDPAMVEVRRAYVVGRRWLDSGGMPQETLADEFNAALAAHDAEVARAAAEKALPSAEALEHLFRAEFKASRTIATMMANAVRGLIRSAL